MSSNFMTLFAWVTYAFVKIHGLTFVRSRFVKSSVSSADGFNTSSNSSVSSTSRLYAKGSMLAYSDRGVYQFCDVARDLQERVRSSYNTRDEVCELLRLKFSSVWWNIDGSLWPSYREFSSIWGRDSYLDVLISTVVGETYRKRRLACHL
jgi:hypothetical protein